MWTSSGPLPHSCTANSVRAPPEGDTIVPLAFTTGGSFQTELGSTLRRWAAQRLADADAGGDAREYINAQRIMELRWLPRLSAAAARGTAMMVGRLLHPRGQDRRAGPTRRAPALR